MKKKTKKICTGQIEASTPPHRANPGHLTVHCAREGGNLNVAWKGGEFEPDLSIVLAKYSCVFFRFLQGLTDLQDRIWPLLVNSYY